MYISACQLLSSPFTLQIARTALNCIGQYGIEIVLVSRAILHHCRAMQSCSTDRKTWFAVLCNERCNVDLDLWICCLELRPKLLHINSNCKTENRAKWCQEIKYSPTLRQTNSLLECEIYSSVTTSKAIMSMNVDIDKVVWKIVDLNKRKKQKDG